MIKLCWHEWGASPYNIHSYILYYVCIHTYLVVVYTFHTYTVTAITTTKTTKALTQPTPVPTADGDSGKTSILILCYIMCVCVHHCTIHLYSKCMWVYITARDETES